MADPTPAQQKFINNELKLMADQDKQLAKSQQKFDQQTIGALGRDAKKYSQLAAKYSPVQAQNMQGLSASARDRIMADQARTNASGQSQARALGKSIAGEGKAATDFMRVMRSAAPQQHREYRQYLHNIRPGLLEQKQASDFRNELAMKEFGLQEDQFAYGKQADAADRSNKRQKERNKNSAKQRVDMTKLYQDYRKDNFATIFNGLKDYGLSEGAAAKKALEFIVRAQSEGRPPIFSKMLYDQAVKAGLSESLAKRLRKAYLPNATPNPLDYV